MLRSNTQSIVLKLTVSAVTIGICLGLLKSIAAAQKGTRKKGTFLQKAGRTLDPYLPAQTRRLLTVTGTIRETDKVTDHADVSHRWPPPGCERSDGRWRSPPTAAPGCDRTSCMEGNEKGLIKRPEWMNTQWTGGDTTAYPLNMRWRIVRKRMKWETPSQYDIITA